MSILSISTPNTSAVYTAEADVIITATVLGFSAARIMQNQPFSFDLEHPADWQAMRKVNQRSGKTDQQEFLEDYQGFLDALSSMSEVLDNNGIDSKWLKDCQSAEWEPGSLITGRAGGATSKPTKRHKDVMSCWNQFLREQESSSPSGYSGRGAYTGFIDDPSVFRAELLQPTKRRLIRDAKRWNPGLPYWGLIDRGAQGGPQNSANLSTDPKVGMGPMTWDGSAPGVVGYTHGMSWAMRESIRQGPWCTPYEIATGSNTTKMASCFACTTYMYAAGYPPSSIHLGRGESWAPLPADEGDAVYDAISQAMNVRWHLDCYNYMKLGGYMLGFFSGYKLSTSEHRTALSALGTKLKAIDPAEGGNLVLDALTVHDSDWKRIKRTLKPATKKISSVHMFV
jgi:hypothetical protein